MNEIYLGKIVNTHGIKGEVRILSDFELKTQVFKKGFTLYVGKNREQLIINSYRLHKNYDMVTFDGKDNINDVLKYKGLDVYVNKSDINYDGFFDEDLINLDVYSNDKYIGKIESISFGKKYDFINIRSLENKKFIVPKIDEFIEKVDLENKKIYINEIKGLFEWK